MSKPTTKVKRHGDTMRGTLAWAQTDTVGLTVQSLTTTQRDALTPNNGDFIYNTTANQLEGYVNGAWSGISLGSFVSKAGDTMTGLLQFSGTTHAGVQLNSLTTAERDALTPAAGMVVYNTTTTDAEGYINGAWTSLSGSGNTLVDWKDSVNVATTADITLSGEQTIDGVLTSTDRILVKDQSTASENGIYVTASGAWSRSTDADADAEVTSGLTVFVEEGTASAGKIFILTTADPITVDTTSLTFSEVSALDATKVPLAGGTMTGQLLVGTGGAPIGNTSAYAFQVYHSGAGGSGGLFSSDTSIALRVIQNGSDGICAWFSRDGAADTDSEYTLALTATGTSDTTTTPILQHQRGGATTAPGVGYGSREEIYAANSDGTTQKIQAQWFYTWADATSTSEDSKVELKLNVAGSVTSALTVEGDTLSVDILSSLTDATTYITQNATSIEFTQGGTIIADLVSGAGLTVYTDAITTDSGNIESGASMLANDFVNNNTPTQNVLTYWNGSDTLTTSSVPAFFPYAADAGGSDAYAISLTPAPSSYVTGQTYSFYANTANTGACTLNINSIGAIAIKKHYNSDPADNDIKAGQLVTVIYDGTNFQMQSQLGNAPSGSGDMVLANVQTVTGAKTFEDATFLLRNSGDTHSATFATGCTAARTYTFQDSSDTVVMRDTTDTLTNKTIDADNSTITNIGASEIKADLVTGQSAAGAFASGDKFLIVSGGALEAADHDSINHDSLTGFVANEHLDWTSSSVGTVDVTNLPFGSAGEQLTTNEAGTALEFGLASKYLESRKASAGTLTAGTPVYISGYNASGWIEIEAADANDPTKMPAVGLAFESITNAANGRVLMFGLITGLNTQSYSSGDELFVSETEGQLTNTKPTAATSAVQKVGIVGRSNVTQGTIIVFGAGRSNDISNQCLDTRFRIADDGDPTKLARFEASAITPGTERTYTFPDSSGTLTMRDTTETLTNKTLTSPTLTTPVLGTPSSGNLGSCTAYPGDSSLVTTGALNSGSITSGFGAIDVGASQISTTGAVRTGDINIGHASDTTLARSGAGDLTIEGNQIYRAGGTDVAAGDIDIDVRTRHATAVFDGGGSAPTAGTKVYVTVPVAGTIQQWRILGDVTGSAVVDVWKDTYANYPPTVADTIAAAAKPTLSTAVKNEDATLTGWTTSVSAGDVLAFNVDSATTITWLTVELEILVT